MDKAKKQKLLELRQKREAEKKRIESQKHEDLLSAIKSLHEVIGEQSEQSVDQTDKLLDKLEELSSFSKEVQEVRKAIESLPKVDRVAISNISDLLEAQKELDLTEVVESIKNLSAAIEADREVFISNKKVEEFIPVRRVRQDKNGRLIFDDDPLQVTVVGGGGSAIASVQSELIDGDRVKVVVEGIEIPPVELGNVGLTDENDTRINPATKEGQEAIVDAIDNIEVTVDPAGLATEEEQEVQTDILEQIRDNQLPDGHNVTVDNLPSEYPLPAAQVSTLTPQTNALTDAQLRATPIDVNASFDTTGLATESEQETQTALLEDIKANQLPDGHNVTVDNQPTEFPLPSAQISTLTPQTDGLTDAQLRAAPIDVNASIDTTELATKANQTNGEQITNERSKLDLIPYAELLTSSDSITPSAGKAIQVVWVQIVANPDNTAANLTTIEFDGGPTLYKVYALGRSAVFTGEADQALNIELDTAEPVSVNIQYRLVDGV